MHVDFDGETGVENHLDRGIEIAEQFCAAVAMACGVHERLRIHAEANMVESGRLDQRDVEGCGPGLEVFFCVPLGIVDLGEPSAEIHAVANVRQAGGGN